MKIGTHNIGGDQLGQGIFPFSSIETHGRDAGPLHCFYNITLTVYHQYNFFSSEWKETAFNKDSIKRGVRVLHARSARASHAPSHWRLSPVSLSVFSLVPDLSFDCSRILEYVKIRTVLQSTLRVGAFANGIR